MASDGCVTDFDSNDDEVAWSHERRPEDDDSRSNRSEASTLKRLSSTSRAPSVQEFGEFQENHGWVQCQSKTYPERLYFHNTYSGCNTWCRPLSRYVRIPFVSVEEQMTHQNNLTANDLELMSVSDSEKELNLLKTAYNRDKSLIETSDVIAQCYYTSKIDPTSDKDDINSIGPIVKKYRKRKGEIYENDKDDKNDVDDDIDNVDSNGNLKLNYLPFHVRSFFETRFYVDEDNMNTEKIYQTRKSLKSGNVSATSSTLSLPVSQRVVYRAPRLKRIGLEDQLVKIQSKTSVPEDSKGPKVIICQMYGVKTINYSPPRSDQIRMEVGVKSSRLSDSDSDGNDNEPPLISSQPAKTTRLYELDLNKNFRQPLLSESSSSMLSSSNTSNSITSKKNSYSSVSTCSTCTTCKNERDCTFD